MQDFGTFKKNAAVGWLLPIGKRVWLQYLSEVGTAGLRSGILVARIEVVHKSRYDSQVYFGINNMW